VNDRTLVFVGSTPWTSAQSFAGLWGSHASLPAKPNEHATASARQPIWSVESAKVLQGFVALPMRMRYAAARYCLFAGSTEIVVSACRISLLYTLGLQPVAPAGTANVVLLMQPALFGVPPVEEMVHTPPTIGSPQGHCLLDSAPTICG